LSFGGGVFAGVVCCRVVCVRTGRTTFSFHLEVDVTGGGMFWALGTFIVARWLFVAWLM
jgi:hypothetical protein